MKEASPAPSPDRDMIRAHIQRISRRWAELPAPAVMELRFFAEHKTPSVARYDVLDPLFLDEAVEHAARMNAAGLNAYAVINPIDAAKVATLSGSKGATDGDIAAAFFNWIDCDEPAATEAIRNFVGPRHAFTVVTGTIPAARPHVYWELEKPCFDLAAWRALQVSMASHIGSDGVVVNPSRIMRLGGTVTWPDSRKQARGYVSELARLKDRNGPAVPFERLRALFPEGKPPAPGSSGSTFELDTGGSSLDRALAAAKIEAGENWHDNIIRLVASYTRRGLSDAEIHAITDSFTLPGWTVEQTRREVQTAIQGARRKGWEPEAYADPERVEDQWNAPPAAPDSGEPSPSRLEWFDDIQPSLGGDYIIKGVIDRGSMSVIYGPSNSGKTFFALDMAFHIAAGAEWRGSRVRGGSVLYLAAEGGRGVMNRIAALRADTGITDVPLALRRAGLDLLKSTADLQQIVDLAAETNARAPLAVIVIDTLSRVIAGGDENSAQDMTAFIRNIDKVRAVTGAHIMIVHHTGKDAARGARGHSSLRAATDTEIEVQTEEGQRAAIVTKQRDNEGGQTFGFQLKSVYLGTDDDGDEVSSCVVEEADADEFAGAVRLRKGIGGNQKIIADSFDQMLGEGLGKPNPGGVGMPEAGEFWTVEMEALRAVAFGKMSAANKRDAWRTAWAGLHDVRGLFHAASGLVWALDRKINQ